MLINRAWGLIDMQSKMFEYIDEYDLVAEIMGVDLKTGESHYPIEDGFSAHKKKNHSGVSLPPHKKDIDSEEEVNYEQLDDNVWDELERSHQDNSFVYLCDKSVS